MNHKLRILKSVLAFLFLLAIFFGALALLPALAQTPPHGRAAPDEPFAPKPGDITAQLVASSTTGYLIDDGMAGFSTNAAGPDGWAAGGGGGYGNAYHWTNANNNGDYAEWRPDLGPGTRQYEVLVHYPAHSTYYSQVKYSVVDSVGTHVVYVNQQLKADGTAPPPGGADSGWRSLGVYTFLAGTSGYVRVWDETVVGPLPGPVIADAVKFSPLEVWVDDNFSSSTSGAYVWGVTAFSSIRAGIEAVGTSGTVHVLPNDTFNPYMAPITVTKALSLLGEGSPSPVISSTAALGPVALEMLASNVRVSGFEFQTSGTAYAIINWDPVGGWVTDISGYRVSDNVIHGFTTGMYFFHAKGEISNNTIYNNSQNGIFVQDTPSGAGAGPTIISGNRLYGNCSSGINPYNMWLQSTYTGTLVANNTITGSLIANEAGLYVVSDAGDLTLSSNRITGCTSGVWINQTAAMVIQKVSLDNNIITGGTQGIRVQRTGGAYSVREVTVGGSIAKANSIYGNTDSELYLIGYSANINAQYNDWGAANGMTTIRKIEDRIRHNYDAGSLGTVDYSNALGVPKTIDVQASPTILPADGTSTAVVTATVLDAFNRYVPNGSMIGITTSLGSVPYGFAEGESAAVVKSAGWIAGPPDAHASGGTYIGTANFLATADWTFTGTAVSLIYLKQAGGGLADVFVDDMTTPITTVNMSSLIAGTVEWQVEDIIATGLNAAVSHTIRVQKKVNDLTPVRVDAFRAGGTVAGQGRIVTSLTSANSAGTATIWATSYTGRIITTSMSSGIYAYITDTVTVTFQTADVYITKAASPSSVTPGQQVFYTITYGNNGPGTATGVMITDTLPQKFVRVGSSLPPNREELNPAGNKYGWTIGTVGAGVTGTITLWAMPDPTAAWPGLPAVYNNNAEIVMLAFDSVGGNNNSGPVPVTVVPSVAALVTVTAFPTTVMADGVSTVAITATAVDGNNLPVLNGSSITFSTNLGTFPASASNTLALTTTGGVATTTLQASFTAGTATVRAQVDAASGSTQVIFLPGEPYTVTLSANPAVIRTSPTGAITTALRITVTDRYSNLVNGATVNMTTTSGSFVASGATTLTVTTIQGVYMTSLASSCTVTTATVTAAITTTGRPTATVQIGIRPGLPYTITSTATPSVVRVCGDTALLTATIKDQCGNPVEDKTPVLFTVDPGTRGYMEPEWTLTANGVATSTLHTKSYRFGERRLIVKIASRRETQEATLDLPVDLAEGLPYNIALTPSPATIAVHDQQSDIRALVKDCGGNTVQDGTLVTFTANSLGIISPTTTTTVDGIAEAIFRSGCALGNAVITATADSRSGTTTVKLEPAPADLISTEITTNTIHNCGGRAVITATLYDACGNLVKDNTEVRFGVVFDTVEVRPNPAYSRNGVVTATVTALNKPLRAWPSSLEQIGVASGSAMAGFTSLWLVPGGPENIGVATDPRSIPIDGDVNGYDIIVSTAVDDCGGTPVADGTMVRVQTNLGLFRETGTRSIFVPTVGGRVTGTLTSQSVAGLATIVATSDSAVGVATVRFLPGLPYYVDVWGYPSSVYADGVSRTTITAWIRDEENRNPVLDGITVTFVTEYGHFLGSGSFMYTTTTNMDGYAFATLIADSTPHTVLVQAITYNHRHGHSYVFFVQPPDRFYALLPLIRKGFTP